MARADFDLKALYNALDDERRSRGMSWAAIAREIGRGMTEGHPVGTSTITRLKTRVLAEGDGILQMLLWLRRTPESLIPGFPDADAGRFRLPDVRRDRVLRWDTRALHSALNAQRQARGMTWMEVAREVGGVTPGMLTNLAKGGRTAFPGVMRVVGWLDRPAVTFLKTATRTG
jgi:hypothetical protein